MVAPCSLVSRFFGVFSLSFRAPFVALLPLPKSTLPSLFKRVLAANTLASRSPRARLPRTNTLRRRAALGPPASTSTRASVRPSAHSRSVARAPRVSPARAVALAASPRPASSPPVASSPPSSLRVFMRLGAHPPAATPSCVRRPYKRTSPAFVRPHIPSRSSLHATRPRLHHATWLTTLDTRTPPSCASVWTRVRPRTTPLSCAVPHPPSRLIPAHRNSRVRTTVGPQAPASQPRTFAHATAPCTRPVYLQNLGDVDG